MDYPRSRFTAAAVRTPSKSTFSHGGELNIGFVFGVASPQTVFFFFKPKTNWTAQLCLPQTLFEAKKPLKWTTHVSKTLFF